VTISITSYLLDILRPDASSVGPVQQVFDRLACQRSTVDSGAAGRATASSSFPFSGGAAAVHTPGVGDEDDADDDEAELSLLLEFTYFSSSSPYLPGCPPLPHVSSVASQASPTSSSTNTTTSGNKIANTLASPISPSRDKSFRKNSSETCDDFEEDPERTQSHHDTDNEHGQDFEQAANLLDVAGGDMAGNNMKMEALLHLGDDQAGANLDMDQTQPQDAVAKVCIFVTL